MKKILTIIAISLLFCWNLSGQKQGKALIDSLLTKLPATQDDTIKIDILNKLSFRYANFNIDSGLFYGKASINLAKEKKWIKGEASANNSVGLNYMHLGDLQKAIEFYKESLRLNLFIANHKGCAINYRNLGILYVQKEMLDSSLEYAHKSMDIYQSLCDREGMAAQYCNIGNIFFNIDDDKTAMTYFSKALKMSREADNKRDIALNLNNRALVYRDEGNLDQALKDINEAIEINEKLIDKYGLILTYRNKGSIHSLKKHFEEALSYFQKSLSIAVENKFNEPIGACYGWIGKNYLAAAKDTALSIFKDGSPAKPLSKKQLWDSAFKYLDIAITYSKNANNTSDLYDYYRKLSEVYAYYEDYKNAYKYSSLSISLKNQTDNPEFKKNIWKTETTYILNQNECNNY